MDERIAAEWAWAAGLFEGEGTIALHNDGRRVGLSLGMTDPDVVRRFRSIVGVGTFEVIARDERQPHYKRLYRWQISRHALVIEVLTRFRPWLGERRRAKADEALDRIEWSRMHCARGHDKPQDQRGCGLCNTRDSCRRGHAMSGDNLGRRPNGGRYCRACSTINSRELRERKQASA